MNALESLIREHQLIARLAAALEAYARRLGQGTLVDAGDLALFARGFTEFADDIHHDKEENVLLPLLSREGFDWNTGVLAAVNQDHRQERYLIEVLAQLGERPGSWSPEDCRHVVAAATALCDFQRHHHQRENGELFPEVGRRLSGRALDELAAALAAFDADPQHRERRAAAVAVAEQLIARYAPEPGKPD